jgi:excisionase family DNA binding protein
MSAHRAEETDLPHANDELLTLEEVAALVRAPVATVRYWRAQGHGPRGFRVGRAVRFWRTEVVLWIEAQAGCPQPGDNVSG